MTSIVRFALGLCAFAFLTYSAVPGLLKDTAHRGYWQPTHEWAAEKAKCTRYTFVVSNCSVTAVRLFSPSAEKRHLDYFTFANWGGESVAFVRSTKDPSVITLRSAADGLFGRWMFFLVLVALGAVLAVASFARPRVPRADPAFT
jgi:hypothetical protein